MMKEYDFVFSLGAACSCSQSLREAGLQFASYPFDWVGSPGILKSVKALETEFADWFRKEDLKLIDVRREPLSTRCYNNRSTGFGFYHEFSLFKTFDETYPVVAEQFRRREVRLLRILRNACSALAVYVEVPFREQGTDDDFIEAQRRLGAAFPQTSIDLLAFRKAPKGSEPVVSHPAPGVTVMEIDFVQFVDGIMSHQVDRTLVTRYLKEHFRVVDIRSEAEKEQFTLRKSSERTGRWGDDGIFDRFYNQVTYKIYRNLSRYLEAQGIIPRERPVRY